MSTGMAYGGYRFWYAFVDSNGYPMGSLSTPDSPVNGTVYDPVHLRGGVSMSFPESTVQQVQRLNEQTVKGKAYLGVSDLGEISLVLSDFDEEFHAAITGSSKDTSTVSGWSMTAPNANQIVFPSMMVGANTKYMAEDGNTYWLTIIYNDVEIKRGLPQATQNDGDNPNNLEFTLVPKATTRTPLGYLYSGTGLGVQSDSDIGLFIIDDDPILLSTYVDDNSATSATVGYKPASSAVDGSENSFTTNGSDSSANVSAFSTSTGATTHTAAAAGAIWVIGYGANSNFTATS